MDTNNWTNDKCFEVLAELVEDGPGFDAFDSISEALEVADGVHEFGAPLFGRALESDAYRAAMVRGFVK